VTARLAWQKGGDATITRIEGEQIDLVSSIPFAPGSRPEATLDPSGEPVWMKVHGSHRQPDGTFKVEARLLNATRGLRTLIEQATAKTGPDPAP
jgi:hypothetical protein